MFVYRDDVYKEREEARKEKEAKDKVVKIINLNFINKPVEEAESNYRKQRNGPNRNCKTDFQKALINGFVDKERTILCTNRGYIWNVVDIGKRDKYRYANDTIKINKVIIKSI